MSETFGFFARQTIAALANDLRAGRRTSAQLIEASLAAIESRNPRLNAFVRVDAQCARAAALRADDELRQGIDRGPLHGMPVAIKDLIDIAGQPTTQGSALYLEHVAHDDAACVRQLRAAGAVPVGKTTLHEFAYGATGDRSVHGAARNPHAPARMSGGSSGGSAVAVAAGMVPLALGTDTAGSVRVPAALCGVAGFKPAWGAISCEGVRPLAASLDHVGLFARNAEDVALAYGCLAPLDAAVAPAARIGWIVPSLLARTDPRIARAVRERLGAAGLPVDEVDLPAQLPQAHELFEIFSTLQASEAFAVHAEDVARGAEAIDAEVLQRLRRGEAIPAWRYVRALAQREAVARAVADLLRRHEVLALPTVPMLAPTIGERMPRIDGAAVEVRAALLSLTSPWNLVGLPAISVPVGRIDGLPIALQLVAAAGREAALFRLAATLEGVA
ncbi:amidase [Variovorax sp. DAIF25]|uniref:amidase n=1 Tax=Variovorax sp. DAIF25 TaxID=3080983 RepID=UPI003D6B68F1